LTQTVDMYHIYSKYSQCNYLFSVWKIRNKRVWIFCCLINFKKVDSLKANMLQDGVNSVKQKGRSVNWLLACSLCNSQNQLTVLVVLLFCTVVIV